MVALKWNHFSVLENFHNCFLWGAKILRKIKRRIAGQQRFKPFWHCIALQHVVEQCHPFNLTAYILKLKMRETWWSYKKPVNSEGLHPEQMADRKDFTLFYFFQKEWPPVVANSFPFLQWLPEHCWMILKVALGFSVPGVGHNEGWNSSRSELLKHSLQIFHSSCTQSPLCVPVALCLPVVYNVFSSNPLPLDFVATFHEVQTLTKASNAIVLSCH